MRKGKESNLSYSHLSICWLDLGYRQRLFVYLAFPFIEAQASQSAVSQSFVFRDRLRLVQDIVRLRTKPLLLHKGLIL
jgi:F0F1-type ATP synthase assembly protein I